MLRCLAFAFVVSAPLVLVATSASGAAQRTFVASYGAPGNTAFNCSITKPCRAFNDAIGVTNAGGEVIVLDSAGYGSVTVTKAVSIISPPGIYAGISVFSGNDGVTINAPGATLALRGLSINGQGGNRGIFLQAAARVRIESCVVSGMAVAGISHNAAGAEMIVLDTIVRDNSGSGIVVFGDGPSAVLDHVRSEHNGGDGFNFGPTLGSLGALATVIESVFTHNEGNGIGAASVPGATITIVVERSVIARNGTGGFVAAGPVGSAVAATIARSTANDNGGKGISIAGDGNLMAGIHGNTAHRNSDNGISIESKGPGGHYFALKDNVSHSNGPGGVGVDFYCEGPVAPPGVHLMSDASNILVFGVRVEQCTYSSGATQ